MYKRTEEDKQRDLYLKKILEGEIYGPLTGKASLDKPWLKYFSEDVLAMDMPKGTTYDCLVEGNKENMHRIAINYFDEKITYSELIKRIDDTAKALVACGIKEGDMVSIASITTPEAICLFYALPKIGACGNMIDPRSSADDLHQYMEESKSKLLFVIESNDYIDKLMKAKEGTNVEEVFSLDPLHSLSLTNKVKTIFNTIKDKREKNVSDESLISQIKNMKFTRPAGCKTWNDFYKRGIDIKEVPILHDEDKPAVLVHTGGTTGKSKGVLLSNYNLNASCIQAKYCGFDFQTGHRWLNIMPLFIAYGAGNGLHLPLITGMEVDLVPMFDPKKFGDLTKKYKFNHVTGVPSHYDDLISSKALENEDLSFFKSLIMGGDKGKVEREIVINKFLHDRNCSENVAKGYGMTEVSAAVCATSINYMNKLGSVGPAFPHTTIAIFDSDKNPNEVYSEEDELTYNEFGEVCMTGPNTMIGYLNNKEEEKRVLKVHRDGKIWVHSQDIGRIDEDGCVFIEDRMKNIIALNSGFKLYPNKIENAILSHKAVKECKVIGVQDPDFYHGSRPFAFITLNDEFLDLDVDLKSELERVCQEKLPDYSQPLGFKIKNELPLTMIGKVDQLALIDEYNLENNNQKVKKLKK